MNKKFSPHIDRAQEYWRSLLKPGDLAIDATLGNGHDALFLAELGAEVMGLDIQPQALEKALKLTEGKRVTLLHRSHKEIASIPVLHPPKLIVYNLGYLPGGDKSITTLVESTLDSVKQSLEMLAPGGALSITCYPGHDEGLREEIVLLEWAGKLPIEKWSVCHHRWINRPRSPSLLWICAHRP